jgi:hypothetical protein
MRRASCALAAYAAITLLMTWPLVLTLERDVAWDLGDSVLNIWILSWDCRQISELLAGRISSTLDFFTANIFHPAPLTLAYSEHLLPQALLFCPIYAATSNPILGYNLLFLSTFALSAFGTFLLVRDLTGNGAAAFIAGLLFGFALYRIPQSSHLQVLSSQWMPFTLYGLRRFMETRRLRALLGASLALVVQNLSCGYYLLYFTPFAVAYGLWEMWQRGLWRDRTIWLHLAGAFALVVALTVPFLVPYLETRAYLQAVRSTAEVSSFSADVYSYATASEAHRAWGRAAQAFPKAEGELFPGMIPIVLALVGLVGWATSGRARPAPSLPRTRGPRWLVMALTATAVVHAMAALFAIVSRRVFVDLGLFVLRITNVNQMLLRAAAALGIVLAVSPAARARVGRFMRTRGPFLLLLLAAVWLSLGPRPRALGRPLELAAPYAVLMEHVPGFDGLRAPARFAMIATLMLAVLAGYGADAVSRWRRGRIWLTAAGLVFLIEGNSLPFQTNATYAPREFAGLEPRLRLPALAPAIYHQVGRLQPDATLVELPLGHPDFDLRAMFYSTVHWRRLLNGYSGFFPPHYPQLVVALSDVPRHTDLAWNALRAGGATHAIVHEGAYLSGAGAETSAALRRRGAAEIFRDGSDVLLDLNPQR